MKYRLFTAWRSAAVLAAVLVCLICISTPAWAQGFKWWHSERFQRALQLAPEQIERIEEVFQASVPGFRQQKKELDRLEDDLERLIDTSTDEAAVMEQADRVESVRSELSKARTRMLVRMRLVLTPEQRVTLTELHKEYQRNRKRQDRRR